MTDTKQHGNKLALARHHSKDSKDSMKNELVQALPKGAQTASKDANEKEGYTENVEKV